jgi:hypothetical protein
MKQELISMTGDVGLWQTLQKLEQLLSDAVGTV